MAEPPGQALVSVVGAAERAALVLRPNKIHQLSQRPRAPEGAGAAGPACAGSAGGCVGREDSLAGQTMYFTQRLGFREAIRAEGGPGGGRGARAREGRAAALLLLRGQAVQSLAQAQQLLLVLQAPAQAGGNRVQAVQQPEQAGRDRPGGPALACNGTGAQGPGGAAGGGPLPRARPGATPGPLHPTPGWLGAPRGASPPRASCRPRAPGPSRGDGAEYAPLLRRCSGAARRPPSPLARPAPCSPGGGPAALGSAGVSSSRRADGVQGPSPGCCGDPAGRLPALVPEKTGPESASGPRAAASKAPPLAAERAQGRPVRWRPRADAPAP